MKTCGEIMTPNPAFCREGDRVSEAAEIMRDRDIGALPVVRRGGLAGVLTDRDITVRVVAAGLDPALTPVGEVMTPEPRTCGAEERLDRLIETMEARRVRRIPVVDSEGRLVGIVTPSDIAARAHAPLMVADLVEEISRPLAIRA